MCMPNGQLHGEEEKDLLCDPGSAANGQLVGSIPAPTGKPVPPSAAKGMAEVEGRATAGSEEEATIIFQWLQHVGMEPELWAVASDILERLCVMDRASAGRAGIAEDLATMEAFLRGNPDMRACLIPATPMSPVVS